MAVTSRLLSAGHTDVGRKRAENQDRIVIDSQRGIYLVLDGVGGHAAGDRAALIAAEIIRMRLARQTGSTAKRVREALALASTDIFETAAGDLDLRGMACVATLAVVEDERVTVGHVGDSRLYLLEPGFIRKVTHDHSPVGELEDAGDLSEDAAMRHPRRNEVYRDLGTAPHGPEDPDFIELVEFDLPPASALLLCSDGLSDQVRSEDIRRIVEKHAGDPESGAVALIAAANAAGGKDNVSVVLVETAEYAAVSGPARVAPRRSFLPAVAWFFVGLLVAAGMFGALRPYVEEGSTGPVVRFGTVRVARNLVVGPGAYKTISEALERARPGDTVLVGPGEYRENLRLRSGVSVVSTEPGAAKIISRGSEPDGAASGATTGAAGAVVVGEGVHDVRFSGLDIVGPGDAGMRLLNSDVDVENVRISGMHGAGLEIDGGQSSVQASVVEQNGGAGIYIHGAASPHIDNDMIVDNGHGSSGQSPDLSPGVFIAGAATPHLSGNLITDNGAEQVWISPLFDASQLLKDNFIAATAPGGDSREIKVVTR